MTRYLFFCAILFISSGLNAVPVVSSIEGEFRNGSVVVITGMNFGSKPDGRPVLWADFNSGLEPSSLGIKTQWDLVQNMEWAPEGRNGNPCAKASNGSGKWTMRVDKHAWTKEGQKVYIFRRVRTNFPIVHESQNWKIWRMWPSQVNSPNIYVASNNGRIYVENIGQESGFWGNFKTVSTDWHTEEIFFRASSGMGRKDGVLTLRRNGVDVANGTLITRSQEAPAYMVQNYVVHGVVANPQWWEPPWRDSNRMWVDDVYVDTSWAHILIGNEMSYMGSRLTEIQIPIVWADDEIHFQVNLGDFSNARQAYLYIFDDQGRVNQYGYPIEIKGKDPKRGARVP